MPQGGSGTGHGGSGTGSGFTSGEDFVAARVSIDVPDQGIQTLKELSNALNNYRTVVEAAGRSSENFVKYLQQMQQAGQQVAATHQQMAQALQASGDTQNRTMGTGGNPMAELPMSRMAPTAYVDPFSGTGAGMGRQAGASPGSVQEQIQQQYIDPARQLDPYRYAQAQAGRHRTLGSIPTTPTGAPDWGEYANRVDQREKAQQVQSATTGGGGGVSERNLFNEMTPGGNEALMGASLSNKMGAYGGLARNLFNEMAPGGTPMGTLGAMAQGIGAVGSYMSGRSGRGPSGAGPGASGVGAAAQQNAADSTEPGEIEGSIPGMFGKSMGSLFGGALSALPGGKLLAPLLAKLGPGAGILGGALTGLGAVQKAGAMYQSYKDTGLIQGGGAAEGFGDEMRMRMEALDPRISTKQSREIMTAGLSEGYHGKDFDTATKNFKDNLVDFNLAVGDSVKLLRTSIAGGSTLQEAANQSHQIMQTLKNLSRNGVISNPDMQQAVQQLTAGFESQGQSAPMAMHEAALGEQMWNTPETRSIAGDFGGLSAAMQSTPAGMSSIEAMSGDVIPGLMPEAYALYNSQHGKSTDEEVDKAVKNAVGMFFRSPESRVKGSVYYDNSVIMVKHYLDRMAPGNPITKDINKLVKMIDTYLGPTDYMAKAQQDLGAAGDPTPQPTVSTPYAGIDRTAAIANQYGGNQANASGEMVFSRPQELTPRSMGVMAPTAAAPAGAVNTNVNFSPAQVHITVGRDGSMTASPNPVVLTPNQQASNAGIGTAAMNSPPPGENYYRGYIAANGPGV